MSAISKPVWVILAPPYNGLTLLANCLNLLGVTNPDHTAANIAPPGLINRLLLQDLGCNPHRIGSLPRGWMETAAAARARTRIAALLAQQPATAIPGLIADPCMSLLLPLWQAVFREHAIEPRYIHLLRHPWETARALVHVEGVDLFQGHLRWLANHRAALTGSTGCARALLTFDQLLANPVATLAALEQALALRLPMRPAAVYPQLLATVQPSRKHHHASAASTEEQARFAPFIRIYDALRQLQAGFSLEPTRSPQRLTANGLSRVSALMGLPLDQMEPDGADLAELLFEALGEKEQQMQALLPIPRPAGEPDLRLQATFHWPLTDDVDHRETVTLPADAWQRITLPIPRPEQLHDRPLRFTPLNRPGTVWIAALKLIHRTTGDVLWSMQTPQEFDTLELSGAVLRAPDPDNLLLLVTGDAPYISLPKLDKLPEGPVEVEVWVKASRDQSLILDYWRQAMNEPDTQKILILTQSINKVENQLKDFIHTVSKGNFGNVFQPFNRRLENEHIQTIQRKWLPLLNLQLKDSHLRYMAHKICQVENRCSGRLATNVQDALLRVLVAMSVKKKTISIMEIGSLFGVALVSYYECLRGFFEKIDLTALDPLDGYYDKDQFDILTRTPVSKLIFDSNLLFNNVPKEDVLLIQHLSTNQQAFELAEKRRYDVMIIDGDHTFEGVKYDFDHYHSLVSPNGFIFFDDYDANEWPGVKKFVDEEVRFHKSYKFIGSEWRSIVFQKIN